MKSMFLMTIAALGLASVGSAYEANSVKDAVSTDNLPKVSLETAAADAEQYLSGKALSAEYDRKKGDWIVAVKVAGDKQVVDVEVGGAKGKIIATGENLTDVDDDISKTS